jgi:hypothetical protein
MRIGLAIAGFALLLGCSDSARTPDGPPPPDLTDIYADGGTGKICTRSGDCEQHILIAGAPHLSGPIDYPIKPPPGGPHNPCWGEWGVHDKPLAAENWVHNLEHGGVVLLYRCPEHCDSEVADLSDFVASHPRTVLTEYDELKTRFAAIAWGYRLLMDDLDLDAIGQFYIAHFDHGPESIDSPPPAGCGG